jgi:hypothetical protein
MTTTITMLYTLWAHGYWSCLLCGHANCWVYAICHWLYQMSACPMRIWLVIFTFYVHGVYCVISRILSRKIRQNRIKNHVIYDVDILWLAPNAWCDSDACEQSIGVLQDSKQKYYHAWVECFYSPTLSHTVTRARLSLDSLNSEHMQTIVHSPEWYSDRPVHCPITGALSVLVVCVVYNWPL